MEKSKEQPQSPEENLVAKKDKLKKAVMLMLDFQRSQAAEKNLMPHLDEFTGDEIDYLLEYVRYLDNQVQLRQGPFSDTASEALVEDEKNLKELEGKIVQSRVQELKDFFKVEPE